MRYRVHWCLRHTAVLSLIHVYVTLYEFFPPSLSSSLTSSLSSSLHLNGVWLDLDGSTVNYTGSRFMGKEITTILCTLCHPSLCPYITVGLVAPSLSLSLSLSLSRSLVCVSLSPFLDILHPAPVHLTADAFSTDSPGLDRGLTIVLRPVGIFPAIRCPFPPSGHSQFSCGAGRPMLRAKPKPRISLSRAWEGLPTHPQPRIRDRPSSMSPGYVCSSRSLLRK